MKILITGGAGFVGGAVTDLLLQKGHDVTVYDNLTYEARYTKDVPFIYADVRDRDTLARAIVGQDVVIWLAALVGDGACAVNPVLTKEINTDAVEWLVKNYHGRIIFPSTCSIYGANDELLHEGSPMNPLSLYASSKLAAEKFITEHSADHLIFRLATLYGLGDAHSRPRFDLVVNTLAKSAALGTNLTVYGGEQWRPLLHVKDVGEAIAFGIERNIRGLYNLSDKNYRIADIANEVKKEIPGAAVEFHDKKFEDLRNYRVSAEKFKAHGWKPKYDLSSGIREIYELIRLGRVKDPNDAVHSNAAFINRSSIN